MYQINSNDNSVGTINFAELKFSLELSRIGGRVITNWTVELIRHSCIIHLKFVRPHRHRICAILVAHLVGVKDLNICKRSCNK